MLRKINPLSAVFATALLLLSVGNAAALSVFTVGGVKMICQTCTCGEMADAGVPLEHCVDTALVINPGAPKVYDKIIRYSATDVKLHSPGGSEFPLASDAAQKQFDEISGQRNFRRLIGRLRPTAGAISQRRVERLAKELGVEVQDRQLQDGTAEAEQGRVKTLLATIRGGRLVGLTSLRPSRRVRPGGDVYKAQATSRGGKLVLEFDRPLSRESRMELTLDAPLSLDQEAVTDLDTCGCLPGSFAVRNANARNPVVTITASQRPRHAHRWSTKYRTVECPRW